jgi:hypothetical protein
MTQTAEISAFGWCLGIFAPGRLTRIALSRHSAALQHLFLLLRCFHRCSRRLGCAAAPALSVNIATPLSSARPQATPARASRRHAQDRPCGDIARARRCARRSYGAEKGPPCASCSRHVCALACALQPCLSNASQLGCAVPHAHGLSPCSARRRRRPPCGATDTMRACGSSHHVRSGARTDFLPA